MKWDKFRDFYAMIPGSPFESVIAEDFLRFYGQVRTNCFCITGYYSVYDYPRRIGMGLYLQTSRFDHSCDPPLSVHFENSKLHLQPVDKTKSWPDMDFNNLRISYRCWDGTIVSSYERKESLKDIFHFWCDCSKCNDVKNDDGLWTALAQECKICASPLAPENEQFLPNSDTFTHCNPRCFFTPPTDILAKLKCTKCEKYSDEKISLADFMENVRNAIFVSLGATSYDSLSLRPEALEARLENASKILHPVKNAWLAQAYETFLSESLEPESSNRLYREEKHRMFVEKCVKIGTLLAACYVFFDVRCTEHPILCAKLGKWLVELNKKEEATTWYRKAQTLWSKNWCEDHVCIKAIQNAIDVI